jgi:hypothetical protein
MKESTYNTLSKINCDKFVRTKGSAGLKYLSWADAWKILISNYPNAKSTVYENADGLNYHHDNHTAWVKASVKINEIEHIEYLAITNHYNKSIPIDDLTSQDVITTIQRCITKAIARHGLGLYVYTGEDFPKDKLVVGSENWQKELQYIKKNYKQPFASIVANFKSKYILDREIKKEIITEYYLLGGSVPSNLKKEYNIG